MPEKACLRSINAGVSGLHAQGHDRHHVVKLSPVLHWELKRKLTGSTNHIRCFCTSRAKHTVVRSQVKYRRFAGGSQVGVNSEGNNHGTSFEADSSTRKYLDIRKLISPIVRRRQERTEVVEGLKYTSSTSLSDVLGVFFMPISWPCQRLVEKCLCHSRKLLPFRDHSNQFFWVIRLTSVGDGITGY